MEALEVRLGARTLTCPVEVIWTARVLREL